jgi:hypothetical protein
MKKLNNIPSLLGLILMLCAPVAKAQEGERTINREFAIGTNTGLVINNVYGNIDIINHPEEKISIEVNIHVDARDQSREKEMLDNINIRLYQEGNVVYALTELSDNFNRLFRGPADLQINYTIHMPASVPVQLSNKYGNVFIDELTSTSTIDVKYGKLNANRIMHDSREPLTKVILAYSDAVIQETSWLNADIKYAKLSITDSRALALISKYSKIFVTNGSSLVGESKYDSFELGTLDNFVINTAYSNIKIEKLTGRLQSETKYTDVIISNVPSGFESLKINTSYGNYKIGVVPGTSYRIDGSAKYSDIVYPQANARVNRINENSQLQVSGVVGSNQNTRSTVTISANYGNVRLVL